MAANANEDQYFNKTDLVSATRALNEIPYVSRKKTGDFGTGFSLGGDFKPKASEHDALIAEWWGRPAPDGETFVIGWWGKILALLLVRAALLSPSRKGERPDTLGAQIQSLARTREGIASGALGVSLVSLIKTRARKRYVTGVQGETLYRIAARFCAAQIAAGPRADPVAGLGDETAIYTALHDARLTEAETPEGFAHSLLAALGVDVPALKRPAGSRHIDPVLEPGLWHEAGRTSERIVRRHAEDIIAEFRANKTGAPRIIGLEGAPHAGKKAVVVELLALLLNGDGEPGLKIGDEAPLPLIALDLRSRSYPALIRAVCHALNPRAAQFVEAGRDEIATLLDQVAVLHRDCPALFIFVQLEAIGPNDPRQILQRRGFRRLLKRLHDSNPKSRFILTASNAQEVQKALVLPPTGWREIPNPQLERMYWYLSEQGSRALAQEIDAGRLNAQRGVTLRADGLLALAALEPESEEAFQRDFIPRLKDYADLSASDPVKGLTFAYDEAVKEFHRRGILPALILIASSHDGLVEHSLTRCLDWWAMRAPEDHALPGNPQPEPPAAIRDRSHQVQAQLTALSKVARGIFLTHSDNIRHDIEEYGFTEKAGGAGEPAPSAWSIQGDVAIGLLQAVARLTPAAGPEDKGPTLLRHAQRTISFAARRRAQFKKMRSNLHDPFFAAEGIGRDIQSYVSLVGSLDPGKLGRSEATELAPHLNLHRVFALGPDFAPRLALKFAVESILREDIDHDHRLSLVTDQDALRLKLYTLPFLIAAPAPDDRPRVPIAREYGEQPFDPNRLPKRIPPELLACLGPDTLFGLLETIAITSHYAISPKVLAWAVARVRELDPAPPRSACARIVLAMIDASIFRGRWHFAEFDAWLEVAGGHPGGMGGILERMAGLRAFCLGLDANSPQKLSSQGRKIWLWFEARRVELLWHLGRDRAAFEAAHGQLRNFESQTGATRWLALSGRSARKLLRVMMDDHPVWAPAADPAADPAAERDELLFQTRTYLETNISRLVRYAGAERVGVLMDRARVYLLENDLPPPARMDRVEKVLAEARLRAQEGSVSMAVRLELLILDSSVALQAIADHHVPSAVLTERFQSLDENLATALEIAGFVKAEPARCAVRLLILRARELARKHGRTLTTGARDTTPQQIAADLEAHGMHRAAALVEGAAAAG